MNKHILTVIDNQLNPGKYTQKQLEENAATAADAYAAYAFYADAASYWLKRYFERTGENKQDYIDAINKDNKQ